MSDPRTTGAPPHGGTSDPQHPPPEEQVPTAPRRERRVRHGTEPRDVATDPGDPKPEQADSGDAKRVCFDVDD
jgi:hypothetical protein